MKKVLIIGGAGFIGFPLAKRLISEGYNVKIFDNFSNPAKNWLGDFLSVIRGDIADRDSVIKYVEDAKPDTIIHLAALHYIPLCTKDPIMTEKINVVGTKNILDAIKRRWISILKVFNENHKYLGYSIIVFRKRPVVEEPELFIST